MIDKLTLILFIISISFGICAIVTDKAIFLFVTVALFVLDYLRGKMK